MPAVNQYQRGLGTFCSTLSLSVPGYGEQRRCSHWGWVVSAAVVWTGLFSLGQVRKSSGSSQREITIESKRCCQFHQRYIIPHSLGFIIPVVYDFFHGVWVHLGVLLSHKTDLNTPRARQVQAGTKGWKRVSNLQENPQVFLIVLWAYGPPKFYRQIAPVCCTGLPLH